MGASKCGVTGLILAPCCLPRPQHMRRHFIYEVGGHRFSAEQLRKENVGGGAYGAYCKHIFECVSAEEKTAETIPIHRESDHGEGANLQNLFVFARAPYEFAAGGDLVEGYGDPVVIEVDGIHPHKRSEQAIKVFEQRQAERDAVKAAGA